jgi:hypothetical protein
MYILFVKSIDSGHWWIAEIDDNLAFLQGQSCNYPGDKMICRMEYVE